MSSKEIHFEDIWNEAERLAGIMIASDHDLGNQLQNIRVLLDKVRNEYTIEQGYNAEVASEFVGKVLWELCSLCKQLELAGQMVNSASALQNIINEHTITLMESSDEKN